MHPTIFLTLAVLTVLCGWIVMPYTLTIYNTRFMPRCICPDRDYLSRAYHYHYPAQEARISFAIMLFLCALAVVACTLIMPSSTSQTHSILLLYAPLMPAYLLHRILCFHQLNEFTPLQTVETTNRLNVYRTWKVILLCLIVCGIQATHLFSKVPLQVLGSFTLALSGVAIFAHFIAIKREIQENREVLRDKAIQETFLELMPSSYYLLFALLGIGLTQAAFWLTMPVLLIGWVVLVMAFTGMEYYFRFVSPYRTDGVEQWGEEHYTPLYPPEEELWIIRRYNEAALRRRNSPCWTIITESPTMPGHYRVQLTADLTYKQREIELRREKLLYIRRFNTVNEAHRYAQSIDSEQLMGIKIRELNPTYDNLNQNSTIVLSHLNTMI